MQKRKPAKKLTVHKAPLDSQNVLTDLRMSLEEKEEVVATDTRERDSLARHLADLERAAKEMAQALNRHIETRPNLLNELKGLSTRLAARFEAISKRVKPNERSKISRIVESVEKALDCQSANLKSSEREAQTASREYAISKRRAGETDEERRRLLELPSDLSKELNEARDLQGRIEIAEVKNPELAWGLSLELKRLLSRLKGPSPSAFEQKLKVIWIRLREDREALMQAALSRDAAVARFEREKANFERAVKNKSGFIETALSKRPSTREF